MKFSHFVFAGMNAAPDRRAHEQKVASQQERVTPQHCRDRSKLYSARIWL